MIETKTCINVWSDMNTWIDFCIVIGAYEDLSKAEEIIQNAYDDWFACESDETIADYISYHLSIHNIEHEIYFKDEEEE